MKKIYLFKVCCEIFLSLVIILLNSLNSYSDEKVIAKWDDLLKSKHSKSISDIREILKEGFFSNSTNSDFLNIDFKNIIFITPQEAAIMALHKNLLIKSRKEDIESARQAILEADAIFDPVLGFSFSELTSNSYKRGPVTVNLLTRPYEGDEVELPTDPNKSDPQPVKLKFISQARGDKVQKEIYASKDPDNGATTAKQYQLNISQQMPWGTQLNLSMVSINKNVYYDKKGHSYNAPWSSSILLNILTPIPWTKGFGEYGPQSANVKLAKKEGEKSFWMVKSFINETLKEVDFLYWEVVSSIELLKVAIENRKLLMKHLDLVNELYKEGEATNYELHQSQAAVTNTYLQEEIARNNMVNKCGLLSNLLQENKNQDKLILFLPYHYYEKLYQDEQHEGLKKSIDTAIKNRPELKAGGIEMDQAKISEKMKENQILPDLVFQVSGKGSQNGDVFGYKSYGESVDNILKPDIFNGACAVSFNYPIGNRANLSLLDQAIVLTKTKNLLYSSIGKRIAKDVSDAISLLDTAKARGAYSKDMMKYAQFVYDDMKDSEKSGNITQYEILANFERLNASKQSYISAMVDIKKAKSLLDKAVGSISEKYVNEMMKDDFNKMRIYCMDKNRLLAYFSKDE